MNFGMQIGMKGRYHLQVIREDGSVKEEREFDNLITNAGLDYVYSPPFFFVAGGGSGRNLAGYCCVGTGTTTPANTDTKLSVWGTMNSIYGTSSYTTTYVAGSPSVWQYVTTYTFSAGVATGTWSEIGVGPVGNSSGANVEPVGTYLFSHALIVDGLGAPTTISVLASEQLVVTYTLLLYITNTDVSYTPFLINTTSTSGTLRPANVSSPNSGFPSQGAIGVVNFIIYTSSTLGAITGAPTGTSVTSGNSGTSSYSTGTYFATVSATWPASAPLVNTWNSIQAGSFLGMYQFTISPPVVIGAGASFSLSVNVSWARH